MDPTDTADPSTLQAGAPGSPFLRDAAELVARAAADQLAADEARARFRQGGLPTADPDDRIGPLLWAGEQLHAIRSAALLDRREPAPGERATGGLGGDLYLTSLRLVLAGQLTVWIGLETIEDVVVSGERLLLTLRDGRGMRLQVGAPRRLAVEIAAARSAARRSSSAALDGEVPTGQPAPL